MATACGDDDTAATTASTQAATTTSATPDKVKIALGFVPNTNHAGIYIAKSMGFFAAQNIDVEIVPWAFTVTGVPV